MIGHLLILVQIALRNLFSSFINVIIGAIILVGTFVFVVGGSIVDSLDTGMTRSVTGSVAGHLQIYSAQSKDELSLYGSMGGDPSLANVGDFPKVKAALLSLPNVKTVVPMGINSAILAGGNTVDLALSHLRELYRQRDGQAAEKPRAGGAPLAQALDDQKAYVRQMLKALSADLERAFVLADRSSIDTDGLAALELVSRDDFWSDFDRAPYDHLELLENKVAPLVTDADMLFMRYVGTDLDAFQRSFDRMQIVDGTRVPPGRRGMLLSKVYFEERLKLKPARRLDKVKEAISDGKRRIGGDSTLEKLLKDNQTQTREIVLQLDAGRTRALVERLQRLLSAKETDVGVLLARFFEMTDQNFEARYRFFYDQIAPLLELYRVRVGDVLTIKAFTRSGSVQSINVKVYGTFNFKGLESSILAGGLNLVDLMTFRDLYGHVGADKLEEIRELEAAAGAKKIDRANAEAELFGSDTGLVAEAQATHIDDAAQLSGAPRAARAQDLEGRVYTQQELEDGVVLNAAVILKDPSKLRLSLREIEQLARDQHLDIKVVSWQQASGLLGQLVLMIKGLLFFSVLIISIISIVIINNAMMMATLQRTPMIGTLRAIGAQRGFVLSIVVVETAVLGAVFGGVGMALGWLAVKGISSVGIPATKDILYLLFSGPRFYPTLGVGNLVLAFVIVLLVSLVSTFMPAVIATGVSPLRAMQTED